ncbi:hypothetical protein H9P43_005505 [Blastocladiella emersonii ATCC 22665]|nr:hypothetical protein H9P43_005505 [Blastocladiella emersonii ATCC 22665]
MQPMQGPGASSPPISAGPPPAATSAFAPPAAPTPQALRRQLARQAIGRARDYMAGQLLGLMSHPAIASPQQQIAAPIAAVTSPSSSSSPTLAPVPPQMPQVFTLSLEQWRQLDSVCRADTDEKRALLEQQFTFAEAELDEFRYQITALIAALTRPSVPATAVTHFAIFTNTPSRDPRRRRAPPRDYVSTVVVPAFGSTPSPPASSSSSSSTSSSASSPASTPTSGLTAAATAKESSKKRPAATAPEVPGDSPVASRTASSWPSSPKSASASPSKKQKTPTVGSLEHTLAAAAASLVSEWAHPSGWPRDHPQQLQQQHSRSPSQRFALPPRPAHPPPAPGSASSRASRRSSSSSTKWSSNHRKSAAAGSVPATPYPPLAPIPADATTTVAAAAALVGPVCPVCRPMAPVGAPEWQGVLPHQATSCPLLAYPATVGNIDTVAQLVEKALRVAYEVGLIDRGTGPGMTEMTLVGRAEELAEQLEAKSKRNPCLLLSARNVLMQLVGLPAGLVRERAIAQLLDVVEALRHMGPRYGGSGFPYSVPSPPAAASPTAVSPATAEPTAAEPTATSTAAEPTTGPLVVAQQPPVAPPAQVRPAESRVPRDPPRLPVSPRGDDDGHDLAAVAAGSPAASSSSSSAAPGPAGGPSLQRHDPATVPNQLPGACTCDYCTTLAHVEPGRGKQLQPRSHGIDDCPLLAPPLDLAARIHACLNRVDDGVLLWECIRASARADGPELFACAQRLVIKLNRLGKLFPSSRVALVGLEHILHRSSGEARAGRLAELFELVRADQHREDEARHKVYSARIKAPLY